jgi:hypothetical protein
MGGTTSSYATAGIALRVSGALKPHHHDKVEIPSVGVMYKYRFNILCPFGITGFFYFFHSPVV